MKTFARVKDLSHLPCTFLALRLTTVSLDLADLSTGDFECS